MIQNYNAVQTTNNNEFIAARNRFRLNIGQARRFGGFNSELDFIQRYNQSAATELQLRELYIDWFLDDYDIRIGRQQIIWGRAIGGFVTDILTPVDLREFMTQDAEDLRIGLTAINATRYYGNNQIQLIVNPVFEPDLLPSPDSRWFPVQPLPGPIPARFNGPEKSPLLKEAGVALRYGLSSPGLMDLDLMLLRWTHPMPAYAITFTLLDFPDVVRADLNESYQNSLMAGFSASVLVHGNFRLTTEGLFVKNRVFNYLPVPVNLLEDALANPASALLLLQEFELSDDGYLLTRPWFQAMAGFETRWHGTTLHAQAFVETILNYKEEILARRVFPYVSFLAARTFLRERLQMQTVTRYNIYAEDFWFQLQGSYEIADGFEISLGTHLFGGDSITPLYGHFSFSRFRENSFIFSNIALYF